MTHTLFSVHFSATAPITIEAETGDVEYEDDLIRVEDKTGSYWCFERRSILYTMQSDVTDEEFEELSKPEVERPSRGRRSGR